MGTCIVINKELKSSAEKLGISSMKLELMVKSFMAKNNGNMPTAKQLGLEGDVKIETTKSDALFSPVGVNNNNILSFEPEGSDPSNLQDLEKAIEQYNLDGGSLNLSPLVKSIIQQMRSLGNVISENVNKIKHSESIIEADELREENEIYKKMIDNTKRRLAELAKNVSMSTVADILSKISEETKDRFSKKGADGVTAADIRYFKQVYSMVYNIANFNYKDGGHPITGEEYSADVDAMDMVKFQAAMKNVNEIMRNVIDPAIKTMIEKAASDNLNKRVEISKLLAPMTDINKLRSDMFGMKDMHNDFLTAIAIEIDKSNFRANEEMRGIIGKFEKLFKAVEESRGGKSKDMWKHFFDKKGDLISEYSDEFFKLRSKMIATARDGGAKEYRAMRDWRLDNELFYDIRLLLPQKPLTDAEQVLADSHKRELIAAVGEEAFNSTMNKITNMVNNYNAEMNRLQNELDANPNINEDRKALIYDKREAIRSPYVAIAKILGPINDFGGIYYHKDSKGNHMRTNSDGTKGVFSIPRKVTTKGVATEWHNKEFSAIKNNPVDYGLYEEIKSLMSDMYYYLPRELRGSVSTRTLPFIERSVIESFGEGLGLASKEMLKKLRESVLVGATAGSIPGAVDPFTHKQTADVNVPSMMLSGGVIKGKLRADIAKYIGQNEGNRPSKEWIDKREQELYDELNASRSMDLPKIITSYIMGMVSYKHAQSTSLFLDIARDKFDEVKEVETMTDGSPVVRDGAVVEKAGLAHAKKLLDYNIKIFKGYSSTTDSWKFGDKVYSAEEKARLEGYLSATDELNRLKEIANAAENYDLAVSYDKAIADMEAEINKMGGYRHLSRYGENLLAYNQLRGMGFNAISGAVNLTTGFIENTIKAADGRFYSQSDLMEGYKLTYSIAFSNPDNSELAMKIKNLSERLRIFSDSTTEKYLESNSVTDVAFIITKKTEFVNVMSQAIAYMKNVKVIDDKGQESNLFEAYDNDGNLKAGWVLKEGVDNITQEYKISAAMNQLRDMTHGDYRSHLKGKESFLGKAAFQFRTWMPMMFESRIGSEYHDDILGVTIKGRWRSYTTMSGHTYEGVAYTAMENATYFLGQLGMSFLGQKANFEGRMSEVDAANMKANIVELQFVLAVSMALLMLGAAVDDDDKKKFIGYYMLMNLLRRQQTDLMLFANPMSMEELSSSIIPALSAIKDIKAAIMSIPDLFFGDDKESTKAAEKVVKLVPPGNQIIRTYKYFDKEVAR